MAKWAVVGIEVPMRGEGKERDPWMTIHCVGLRPAGAGRDMRFMAGRPCKVLRVPSTWWTVVQKPAIYDLEEEAGTGRNPRTGEAEAFTRLVAVEYVEELPEALGSWVLTLNQPPTVLRRAASSS